MTGPKTKEWGNHQHRLGRSRSEFMLEAFCREAADVLLDQAFFRVDTGTFPKLQALLDRARN